MEARTQIPSEITPLLESKQEVAILLIEETTSFTGIDDFKDLTEDLLRRLNNYQDILVIKQQSFCNLNLLGAMVGLVGAYSLFLNFKDSGNFETFTAALFLALFGLCNAYSFVSDVFYSYEYQSYSLSELKREDSIVLKNFSSVLTQCLSDPKISLENEIRKELKVLANQLLKNHTMVSKAKQDLEKFKTTFFNQHHFFNKPTQALLADLEKITIEEITRENLNNTMQP